jgi:hypothetical protein
VIAESVDYTHTDPTIPMSATIGWELPFTPHGVPGLTKDMAERLQLESFAHDYWEGRGSIPVIMVSQGERPDFRVRTVAGESGVRGHGKVPTGGQVEVPVGGQVEVPTLRVSYVGL